MSVGIMNTYCTRKWKKNSNIRYNALVNKPNTTNYIKHKAYYVNSVTHAKTNESHGEIKTIQTGYHFAQHTQVKITSMTLHRVDVE
jgi:hypothetical protein